MIAENRTGQDTPARGKHNRHKVSLVQPCLKTHLVRQRDRDRDQDRHRPKRRSGRETGDRRQTENEVEVDLRSGSERRKNDIYGCLTPYS